MKKRALVVVLGELARSPRMQYHCISLANNNYKVTVIANSGDKSCEELESNQNIQQKLMRSVPDFRRYVPSILYYIIKPIWQALLFISCLILTLFSLPHVIIVQNPPTIPTLPILVVYSKVTGCKLIIDWHNYGYSILALNLKPTHKLVNLSKRLEFYFGRYADAAFCVSLSMKNDLIENHNIKYPIHVLYDRPPTHFRPLTLRKKHNFFIKMKHTIPEFRSPFEYENYHQVRAPTPTDRRGTRFTMNDMINKNVIMYRPNRPAILLSSTSWTEDEDFDMLLDALKLYDSMKEDQLRNEDFLTNNGNHLLPDLVCVVTGKGPLKEIYKGLISECCFKHIEMLLPWLSVKDYAKMVGSADIGISLHSSSSGVDLPMKVVDMFGCGVPVLAYRYEAINELVKEDFYGLTFEGSSDLFVKLTLLLEDFNSEDRMSPSLARYRKNISRHFLLSRWEDNWRREAKPIVESLSGMSSH